MKHLILLFFIALAAPLTEAAGQNLALGERVPDIKAQTWLKGQEPQAAPLTYIEFFHSSSKASTRSLERLKELASKHANRLRIVIVTREPADKIEALLAPYLTKNTGAIIEPSGKTFTAFGVTYLPFGVLVDAKNRALWMGNTLQLPENTLK